MKLVLLILFMARERYTHTCVRLRATAREWWHYAEEKGEKRFKTFKIFNL